MAKRPYTKKNWDYWHNLSQTDVPQEDIVVPKLPKVENKVFDKTEDFEVTSVGEPYASTASRIDNPAQSRGGRKNRVTTGAISAQYSSIYEFSRPFAGTTHGSSIRESVILCQLAYDNVPIFKNSIDLMSEFSNSDLFFEGGSKAANMFFEQWFKTARIQKFRQQYFLEYYRSSNVFIYRFNGKLSTDASRQISKFFSNKEKFSLEIPTRYTILNPVDVVAANTTTFSNKNSVFVKVLSQYEIDALKNPKTDADKAIYDSLSPENKAKIKNSTYNRDGITIDLDATRLIYSFAKKQDYEPFATPFGFPVLRDINAKLELKKYDQAVMRTIENVILLITMGTEPEKGGINQNNLAAMREMFTNESVGRILISDYTTKGEFIIPDIAKVVGPEKYTILNEDIKEGLQNIITGSEKSAATQIKAQLFMERLNEARDAFLYDFLIPEMEMIAKAIGLKQIPTVRFSEKSLKDEVQFARAITRLMELGIVHPDEGLKALNTGYISDDEETRKLFKTQFKKDRDAGYYEPIIGGGNKDDAGKAKGAPAGSKAGKSKPKTKVSLADTKEVITKANGLNKFVSDKYKSLGGDWENNKELIQSICESVICARDVNEWESSASDCMENPDLMLKLEPMSDILDISAETDLSTYSAALLYHATKN